MGRRGPLPRSDAAKLTIGAKPSSLLGDPPDVKPGRPRMPGDMSTRAKAVWAQVIRDMPTEMIGRLDAATFRIFCESLSRYEQASVALDGSGLLLEGPRGAPIKNPLNQVVREQAELVRTMARELGLTPAARAALLATKPPEQPTSIDDDIGLPGRFRVIPGPWADEALV